MKEIIGTELVDFACNYAALGGSVQRQLVDLMAGCMDVNPNAVKLIKQKLGGINNDIDEAIALFEGLNNE